MANLVAERVRVSDLRGSTGPTAGTAVLEDPTGRRRRRLRLASRVIAVALTLWLVALVLGGVGLSPVPGVPFAHVLRPASPPPATKRLPKPAQPTAADLQPALPAGSPASAVAAQPVPVAGQRTTPHAGTTTPATKHSPNPRSVAVHTMPPSVDGAPAAGQRATPKTTHPNNGKGSGATTTTTTTTTTTPGRSGAAPGQTGTTPGRLRATPTIP